MGYTNISTRTGKPVKSKDELAQRIDAKLRQLKLHSGPEEFDPVLLMAIIAAESYDVGDVAMALTAAREVAAYVRPKLQSVAVQADLHMDVEVSGAKDRFLAMAKANPHLVEEVLSLDDDEPAPPVVFGKNVVR